MIWWLLLEVFWRGWWCRILRLVGLNSSYPIGSLYEFKLCEKIDILDLRIYWIFNDIHMGWYPCKPGTQCSKLSVVKFVFSMTASLEKLVLDLFFNLKTPITILQPFLLCGMSNSGFEEKFLKFRDWGIQIVSNVKNPWRTSHDS